MKIIVEFDVAVDGKCANVEEVFLQYIGLGPNSGSGIDSTQVDGSDCYFLSIEQATIIKSEE